MGEKINKPMSLVSKLIRIMSEIDRIPKNGVNRFHNYNYVQESDLVEVIRKKLAEYNVILLSNVIESSIMPKQTARGDTSYITTVKIEFTFVDGDTGEERTFVYHGQGEDPGDKGIYKAYTGTVKYALMKTFLIATGDDPESDVETDMRHHGSQQQPIHGGSRPQLQPQNAQNRPATERQVNAIYAIAKGKGLDKDGIKRLVQRETNKDIDQITSHEASYLIEYLQKIDTATLQLMTGNNEFDSVVSDVLNN